MNSEKVEYVKLVSGEDLLGELVSESESQNTVVFKNMILINYIPNSQGQVGVQMLPFPMATEDGAEINFYRSALSIRAKPNENFMHAYRERFGGIQVVKNPGIIV